MLLYIILLQIIVSAQGTGCHSPPPDPCAKSSDPCEAKSYNPCDAQSCDPCDANSYNPCDVKSSDPCEAKSYNPCDFKSSDPCDANSYNPCDVKSSDPCEAKSYNPCDFNSSDPCEAKSYNPCDFKSSDPCDANSYNPCDVKSYNPCDFKSSDPCDANSYNPCDVKSSDPCDANSYNPCDVKSSDPCEAKSYNPCDFKSSDPCEAKSCNPCDAKSCNPCDVYKPEKVKFQFYYDTTCHYSISRYTQELEEAVRELAPYLDISTYPFGNGQMWLNGPHLTIQCQNDTECYGNKLHACAIDELKDPVKYVPFNSCMMRHNFYSTSYDHACDACGRQLYVNSQSIKNCAKGVRGFQKLLDCATESKKVHYVGIPWWYINGVSATISDLYRPLKEVLCNAFLNPPNACRKNSYPYY